MFKTYGPLLVLLLLPPLSLAVEPADPMRRDDQPLPVPSPVVKQGKSAESSTSIKGAARHHLILQSIQLATGERSATINGKLLKVGDKIGRAQIVAIEHNSVRLRKGREEINLMFLPRSIKR